jgi:hypothetical protein
MSLDKRSVTTDALETLGTIITEAERRDAIHLAVEPVVAMQELAPGQDVGFVLGGVGRCESPVGIVDPFLNQNVKPGERFWLVVYPREITSLRHVWTHPAFEEVRDPVAGNPSELWLRDFAARIPAHYEDVLDHAAEYVRNGEYWSEGGRFEGEYVPDEFWLHYEIVTGKPVAEKDRGSFFSCSC